MATGIGPQLGLASNRQLSQSQHSSRSSPASGALSLHHVAVAPSSGRLSGSYHVAGRSRRPGSSGSSGLILRRFRENDTEFDVAKDIKVRSLLG